MMHALLLALALPAFAADPLVEAQAALSEALKPKQRWAAPRYDARCVLEGVLAIMNLPARPEIPLPPVFLESKTPLKKYQDAVEPQWGFRPDRFANVYAAARNEIYLVDEAGYYERLKRFVDDSLAHELVHFVQVKHKAIPITEFDESMESEAVAVQTEFRERFMKKGASPCQAP